MTDAPAPAAPAEPATILDDLIEIWFAPGKVFARRANGGFALVLLIFTVVIGLLAFANRGALESLFDAEMRRQMAAASAQGATVTEEQMAAARRVSGIFASIGAFIGVPIGILLLGLGTWVTARLLGAEEFQVGQGMTVAAYSYATKVAASVALSVQAMLLDPTKWTGAFQPSLGVGRFLDPDMTPGVLQLLGRIDVFTLWGSVLVGIGIVTIGKLPRGRIVPAAAVIWLLGAIPAFWQLLMGALRGA